MKLIYRYLCIAFGVILGTGCSDPSDPGGEVEYGPIAEYGVPTGTVHASGRVLDHLGTPIPGVQVSVDFALPDTTDAQGNWAIDENSAYIPCSDGHDDCLVEAEDIDGPANGGPYPTTSVVLNLVQTTPGSGSWNVGTWEQHGIDIVLANPKKNEALDKETP